MCIFAHLLFFYVCLEGVEKMAIRNRLEREFQAKLIKELQERYPDAIISKADFGIQGFPDLIILKGNTWAMLECKKEKDAKHQPNQDYYVDKLDGMSFSRFIYPENKEDVLRELESTFNARRKSRSSRRK